MGRSGRLAGYRIFRDGLPVRQVRGRSVVHRDLARRALQVHGRRDRPAGIHERRDRAAVGHDRAAAADAGSRARVPAGLDRRELPRPAAPLHADRHACTRRTSTAAPRTARSSAATTRSSRAGRSCGGSSCCRASTASRGRRSTGSSPNDALRSATLTKLVGLVREHGYDGINVDFETGRPRTATRSQLRLGARPAAARDRQALSVEVSAKYGTRRRDGRASTTTRLSAASRTTCS